MVFFIYKLLLLLFILITITFIISLRHRRNFSIYRNLSWPQSETARWWPLARCDGVNAAVWPHYRGGRGGGTACSGFSVTSRHLSPIWPLIFTLHLPLAHPHIQCKLLYNGSDATMRKVNRSCLITPGLLMPSAWGLVLIQSIVGHSVPLSNFNYSCLWHSTLLEYDNIYLPLLDVFIATVNLTIIWPYSISICLSIVLKIPYYYWTQTKSYH